MIDIQLGITKGPKSSKRKNKDARKKSRFIMTDIPLEITKGLLKKRNQRCKRKEYAYVLKEQITDYKYKQGYENFSL